MKPHSLRPSRPVKAYMFKKHVPGCIFIIPTIAQKINVTRNIHSLTHPNVTIHTTQCTKQKQNWQFQKGKKARHTTLFTHNDLACCN